MKRHHFQPIIGALSACVVSYTTSCAPAPPPPEKIVGMWQMNVRSGLRTVFDDRLHCRILEAGQADQPCVFTVENHSTRYRLLYGDRHAGDLDWIDNDNFQIPFPSDALKTITIRFHRVTS